ncbi:MAG: hypothetical protein ACFFAU_15160 [Candidatus Hodarchaeota archaeon]
MKFTKKPKLKVKFTVVALIALFLMTEIIPFIKAEEPEPSEPPLPEYLFLSYPTTLDHSFLAKGECYLYADVNNTDFISVMLDREEYVLSYGINTFPIEFSEIFEEHNVSLPDSSSTCIKSFAIEPLFIAEGNLTVPTSIGLGYANMSFSAGGLISILLKPNFSYNELFVQLDEFVLKGAYVGENYPEIDSQLYSYYAEGGSYIRFDIKVQSKPHLLTINGNGSVEYIIMINDDWDEDDIPDVLEVQKRDFNGFHDLDPTIPNIWGFFEKSEAQVLININETNDPLEGYFNYHINKPGTYFLKIEVEEGEFFDIEFDGDSTTLKNTVLTGNFSNNIAVVNVTDWGWHYVSYRYLSNYNKIKFSISKMIGGPFKEILVLNSPELIDSDGDGVKDFEEISSKLKYQGSDSDGDGLPDNFDNSPFAFLKLDHNKINRFVIPNNPQKNSIVSIQIKKPNNDYSTMGTPRLWRETLNVSITPALRLFGNRYQLYENYSLKELNQTAIDFLWGKSIKTYNLVSGYNTEKIIAGDPLPNANNPDNETSFVFPNFAEESWEFEFSFLRDNPAKSDNILDLRFDFIWILTNYISETNSTEILHYYNFEEDIILQGLTMKEIGDIDYLLATPDNFVENQILWALLQNPTIGTLEDFGVSDDLIGIGTVDYSNITEHLRSDIEAYYSIQTERNTEAEVSYFSGFQDSYDLLNKYILSLNNSLDSPLLNRRDFRSKYSYYSINNVYQDEDIQMGDPEITGEQKTIYYITQNIFNESQEVATISDLPIAMELKNFSNSASNILKITSAISEPIPLNEIPVPFPSTLMHPKIKLMDLTYIERHDSNEQIPKVNFDINTDIEKRYLENRAYEFEQGEIFFEGDSVTPSEAELFASRIDSFFRIDLKNLHDLYNYFNTKQGLNVCSAEIFNPFREFDNFLDNYIDENGQFQVEFLRKEPTIKLQDLSDLDDGLISTLNLHTDKLKLKMLKSVLDLYTAILDIKLDQITAGMGRTRAECGALRVWINAKKGGEIYASKGSFKGKLAYHWDRLKTNWKVRGVIEGVKVAIAGMFLCLQIASFMQKLSEGSAGQDPHNTTLWNYAMVAGFCGIVLSSISVFSGIISTLKAVGKVTETTAKTIGKYCTAATAAIAILLIAIDITEFFTKALHGDFKGSELLFQTITLIANVAVAVIGLALAVASISSGYGAAFGIFIAAMTFLSMWLSSELNKPSIDVKRCIPVLPPATKLNMRRHGGLEVSDTVNYELHVRNNSTSSHGWIRARFVLQETKDPDQGWTTGGTWHSYGNWGAEWYAPPFGIGANFWTTFSQTIPAPTPNLHYRFDLQYDWQKFELIIIIPTWWRTEGTRHSSTQGMEMPVLDNNIADFYDDTSELMSTTLLKDEFERAVNEYQWKDASDIAKEIISRTESKAKTPSGDFVRLNASKQEYNNNYYLYHTTSGKEFYSLIEKHYESGIIAKVPVPEEIWRPNLALGPKMRNMLSYNYSEGDLLIPRDEVEWKNDWFYNKTRELGDSIVYSQKLRNLPLRTNIKTDLRENPLDIDPDTKTCHANFQLYLEGPDNPEADFIITSPEDFTISRTTFTQKLQEAISFTIVQENPYKIMGLYYFELNITLNDVIIYSTFVPIRINDFSLIDYVAHIPTEPIDPGDSFKLLDVVNLGTLPDSVALIAEGIPGDFIYKDFHPDEFFDVTYLDGSLVATYLNGSVVMIKLNGVYEPYVVTYLNEPFENVQIFNTLPGYSREGVVINPPRKYTSVPGLYEFNITAINPRDGSTYFVYQGSFIVAEFHDLDFQCYNPAFSILDNETCTYYFNITNLGNVEEEFVVTYTDIGIASSYLDEDTFVLAPGQTGYFEIMLDPLKLGHEEFVITVASDYITKYNLASITIADDDVDSPVLSDLIIEDDIHHIYATLKACDYSGISEFQIYVDGILIEPQSMTQIGNYYSFVLNNEWILLYGIHGIEIFVTDADSDRAFDNLTSSISGMFEISLDQMYEYVDWQIAVLKDFIEENTHCKVSKDINKKLSQTQSYLIKALEYCESGYITCGLWGVYNATIFLRTAEHQTEIYNKTSWIDDYIAGFIINSIHEIRNNVVILMGVSTDPKIGYEIALIKIELLNLYDFIELSVSSNYKSSLNNYIKEAEKDLETALFKISMDNNPNCSLMSAQWKLEKAIWKVNWILDKGKISQELADIMLEKINQIYFAIEELYYLI